MSQGRMKTVMVSVDHGIIRKYLLKTSPAKCRAQEVFKNIIAELRGHLLSGSNDLSKLATCSFYGRR